MSVPHRLFAADFAAVSYRDWRRRVERELEGASFETLAHVSSEGLVRQPLYTAEDLSGEDPSGFPGIAPFVRGVRRAERSWSVAQEVRLPEDLRPADDHGVDLVWIDPRTASLEALLAHIDFSREVVLGSGTGLSALLLVAEAARRGVAPEQLRGGFGCDPLGTLASRGALPGSLERAFELAADLLVWSRLEAPGMRALLLDLGPYHRAGAEAVAELAFLAAAGAELLRRLTAKGLDVEAISGGLLFALDVGDDIFSEIAKLRAARLLWAKVVRAFGGPEKAQAMSLHARTSVVTTTLRAPWSNLLRGAGATFAAVVGGADSVATAPFDAALGTCEDAGRLALNTQHILREEAYLDRTLDPAGGSYYVEKLTDDLARAAWALFQEIERQGGMARCLVAGEVRERIAATAAKRRGDVARGKAVLVGTSLFADLTEDLPKRRAAAPTPPSEARSTAAEDASALLGAVRDHGFRAAVAAVIEGVPVAEVERARWRETEPVVIEPLPVFRLARAFEDLRDRSDRFLAVHGRRPQVFLLEIGAPADYRARSGFAARFFAAGGFEAVDRSGGPEGDPEASFASSGAEVAVLCSTDELYPRVVPGLARALRERGALAVMLAGRGGQHEELYRQSGVDGFLHLGSDAVALLRDLWTRIENANPETGR